MILDLKELHKKYEMNGKKTLCLPFMRWLHRFERPDGLPYVNDLKDRFRNYMIGFQETKQDTNIVVKQFKDVIPVDYIKKVKKELNLD